MADKNYSATGKPNSTIAGARGAKNSTGNQSKSNGKTPPASVGTFATHYGPGGAGGAGKAPMQGPMKDGEKEPGQRGGPVKVNAPQGMPETAGTHENDYNEMPVDQEKEPGKAARGKRRGKKTFRSIAELRAEVKRRGLG